MRYRFFATISDRCFALKGNAAADADTEGRHEVVARRASARRRRQDGSANSRNARSKASDFFIAWRC
jgi:hypothetical protein